MKGGHTMNRESKILKTFKIKNGRVTRRTDTMDEFITVKSCKKCGTLYETDVRADDNNICSSCLKEEKWVEEELRKGGLE
jgi:uncharacterized OB-fold protein